MDEPYCDIPFLDVPYFQQTRTTTCGPACLMMVMKFWDPLFEFSRQVEFQLWMESFSFFFFGGTFQFGLATTAVKRGYKTEIYQQAHFSAYYPRYPRMVGLIEKIVSHNAHSAKIPIYYEQDILDVIHDSLQRKIPPIVFVNLKPILGENVFHWVVVTAVDKSSVYINDPYVPLGFPMNMKKDFPVSLEVFKKALATDSAGSLRLPPCVILVYKDQQLVRRIQC